MDINEIVSLLLNAAIIPFVAWAVSAFTAYLKDKADNDRLNKYFDLANDAVVTAVSETMQTFVSEMKKSGEWNKDAAVRALGMAKLRAQEIMGAVAYMMLAEIVGDVDAWLTSKIEAAVLTVKQHEPQQIIEIAESEVL